MSCKLSVNVNAIAYLRNRRNLPWPSLEGLGRIALQAGAAGLTIHPRPDERHIRHADVPVLRDLIRKVVGTSVGEVSRRLSIEDALAETAPR